MDHVLPVTVSGTLLIIIKITTNNNWMHYGGGVGSTVEENSNIFFAIRIC